MKFTVFGQAQPAGSKRAFVMNGRAIVTDANAKSKPWKAEVVAVAAEAMRGGPLLDTPLVLELTFYVPRPKSHFGARGLKPSAPAYPAVKPDVLKLARGVEDALSGVVYRDDAQIVEEHLFKMYGEPARVDVFVSELVGVEMAA